LFRGSNLLRSTSSPEGRALKQSQARLHVAHLRASRNRRSAVPTRERLPARRHSITFSAGLRYACTYSRYSDGRLGEVFISNHKTNSGADTAARDAAIAFSFAVQHGADPEAIRRALCRDSHGRPSGPLAAALDAIVESAS